MKLNLRFGMHRDIEVIHQESGKIDGLVIPAHILAHQPAPTAVFVTSLPNHAYVIDPMTYMFQHAKSDWLNDSGDVRLSLRKMCEGYHASILTGLEGIADHATLEPDALPETDEFCQCIVNFQLSVIAKESGTSKAAKYLKRYGDTLATTPRAILPPYFCFDTAGDDWYRHSLACASATVPLAKNVPVMPVLASHFSGMSAAVAEQIAEDYSNFPSVMLWVGNFVQNAVQDQDIIRIRRLVRALSARKVAVETMYGGYLFMLMAFDGVEQVSHGILYTEHKGFEATPGGGGVPDRYYIPAFHEFRSLSQSDLILHKHRELMCGCEICTPVLAGNPDNFIRFADNPDLLRRHFLAVRRNEIDEIEGSELEKLLKDLDETHRKYHASISGLPNPDSITDSRMRGLDYLRNWSAGMRAAL